MTEQSTTTRKTAARKTAARKAPAKRAPAAAKQPQDRKPAAAKTVDGLRVVTVDDVEYRIPVDALDDLDVMEGLQDGNYIPVIRLLLTPAQAAEVKDRLRDPDTDRVKYSDMADFINRLLEAANPNS